MLKYGRMKRITCLFCLCPLILSAQETDIFKMMLKETLKPELSTNFMLDFSDSVFSLKPFRLDATKEFIPRLGFNYEANSLLIAISKEDYKLHESKTISPYLLAPYTNQNKNKPNPYEDKAAKELITKVVATPADNAIMINPVLIIVFLMKAGVIPDEPFISKPSRKERMLKTITQDVYHIDDY